MRNSRAILRWLAALAAVVFMMTAGTSALAASFKARINSSSAKVYNVPSTSSRIYVKGGKNITVTVTGYSSGWARISYRGNTGYTKVENLNLVNRPKAYTAKSTPVYRTASTASRMGTLGIGKTVYVAGISGGYYRIQNASGTLTGYVPKDALTSKSKLLTAYKKYLASINNSASSGSASSSGSGSSGSSSSGTTSSGSGSSGSSSGTAASKIDRVISKAMGYLGRPYAVSDNPPASFNCSSFVEYCFEAYGYSIEGTAIKQSTDSDHTRISSLTSVKRGDILCFDTNGDNVCDHTAIALEDDGDTFIEASQNAGKVQKNEMDTYYKGFFMWAMRP